MSGYDCRNKCVFSFFLNTDSNEADVMSSGRLFQSFGPAEANERSPTVTRRDGRTSSWLEVADRRRRRDGKSATRRRSDRYRGAVPCRARHTRTASLKSMRSGARSQWKLARVSVTWSERRKPAINRAAAAWCPIPFSFQLSINNKYSIYVIIIIIS